MSSKECEKCKKTFKNLKLHQTKSPNCAGAEVETETEPENTVDENETEVQIETCLEDRINQFYATFYEEIMKEFLTVHRYYILLEIRKTLQKEEDIILYDSFMQKYKDTYIPHIARPKLKRYTETLPWLISNFNQMLRLMTYTDEELNNMQQTEQLVTKEQKNREKIRVKTRDDIRRSKLPNGHIESKRCVDCGCAATTACSLMPQVLICAQCANTNETLRGLVRDMISGDKAKKEYKMLEKDLRQIPHYYKNGSKYYPRAFLTRFKQEHQEVFARRELLRKKAAEARERTRKELDIRAEKLRSEIDLAFRTYCGTNGIELVDLDMVNNTIKLTYNYEGDVKHISIARMFESLYGTEEERARIPFRYLDQLKDKYDEAVKNTRDAKILTELIDQSQPEIQEMFAKTSVDSQVRSSTFKNPVEYFNEKVGVYTRERELNTELQKYGLKVRGDSQLCKSYIERGIGNVSTIVDTCVEMHYLFSHTNYQQVMTKFTDKASRTIKSRYGRSRRYDYYDRYDRDFDCGFDSDYYGSDSEEYNYEIDYSYGMQEARENAKVHVLTEKLKTGNEKEKLYAAWRLDVKKPIEQQQNVARALPPWITTEVQS